MARLSHADELLDGPLDDPTTLAGNLRDLARANRWLGGVALSRRALEALAGRAADRGAPISLLDVGTGAVDLPMALLADWERRGRRLDVTAVDERPEVLAAARALAPQLDGHPRLRLAVADGAALPWPDGAFDVAHCSLVLHHLDERAAVGVLREMARVARRGVIVNDLTRGRHFWLGAWLLAHVATRNRYTRHDAPLSVRRAWTRAEARALLAVAGARPTFEIADPLRHRWAIAAVA
jgi:ubiquinone/menaquinone biosynthesis C-methylase UbiE